MEVGKTEKITNLGKWKYYKMKRKELLSNLGKWKNYKMKRKRLLLKAPILSQSGYGEHARFVYRALKKRGDLFDIHIEPLDWGKTGWIWKDEDLRKEIDYDIAKFQSIIQYQVKNPYDICVHVDLPTAWKRIAPFMIGVTAGIECDAVSPTWLTHLSQVDRVVVPSEFSKSGFINSVMKYREIFDENTKNNIHELKEKINDSIDVVNYPVKEIKTEDLNLDLQTDFNFLLIAQWGPRKNIDQTLLNFIDTFKDNENVGLILKTNVMRNSIPDRYITLDRLNNILGDERNHKCKIYLLHGDMTEEEIHSLYNNNKIKAMINFGHGEGYGLPLFEAAYSGLPVVTHDFGGQKDFLYAPKKSKNGKEKLRPFFAKVPYKVGLVQKEAVWNGVIDPDSEWAFPNMKLAQSVMEDVYKNYGMYKSHASKLKKWVRQNFSLEEKESEVVDSVCVTAKIDSGDGKRIDVESARKQISEVKNVKERASLIKKIFKNVYSQEDRLKILKDSFKGEDCYIVSCGPTLMESDQGKVKDLLSDNLTISIKQSYDIYKDLVDIHIYNCANYKEYDYGDKKPIVLEASTSLFELGENDLRFTIKERRFEKSVCVLKNFDNWTLDKGSKVRPYGPGIMYESVFFLLEHLGVSSVTTLGWDNKLLDKTADKQHFYDQEDSPYKDKEMITLNEVAKNQNSVDNLSLEVEVTLDSISDWYDWLLQKGCELKIVSSINPATEKIQRIKI